MNVRRGMGVFIEDMCTYGTSVDGKPVAKGMPVHVAAGAKITLCNLETELTVKEGDS